MSMDKVLLKQFKAVSPFWRMILEKKNFGSDKTATAPHKEKQYWQGYYDACGELMEQIEDYFNEDSEVMEIGLGRFKQQYMLDVHKEK